MCIKGLSTLFKLTHDLKSYIPDSHREPLFLYLRNNEEDIVVFLYIRLCLANLDVTFLQKPCSYYQFSDKKQEYHHNFTFVLRCVNIIINYIY